VTTARPPIPPSAGEKEQEGSVGMFWGLLEVDRWTALLGVVWLLLCGALLVNKMELWVMLASMVAYTCLSFALDITVAARQRLKSNDRARLTNGLVCLAHGVVAAQCICESPAESD
jgi:peptidoglycan/LPS O-acetylase OafA/YrhL